MYFLKTYWERNHKFVPGNYPPEYMELAVPVYIVVWLISTYLSGGYDPPVRTSRVVRGVFLGTMLISAASNFLDAWRFSKALIILGGAWAVAALVGRQLLAHFIRYRNLHLSERRQKNIAIVGSGPESRRVRALLEQAQVSARVIGYVSVEPEQANLEKPVPDAVENSPAHQFTNSTVGRAAPAGGYYPPLRA